MAKQNKKTKVKTPPLVEAWLTLKWELNKISNFPPIYRDDNFPISLGLFYKEIQVKFPNKIELDLNNAPLEIFPFRPRFQFKDSSKNHLLQIGPGVATANHLKNYSWEKFSKDSSFLRKKLINAYKGTKLSLISINLSYKNAIPFEYSSNNLQAFLKQKLNTNIVLPTKIPGKFSKTKQMSNVNLQTTFNIINPIGNAFLMIASGGRKKEDNKSEEIKIEENLVFEIGVESKLKNTPNLYDKSAYNSWLNKSHNLLKTWFSSLAHENLFKYIATKQ